MSFSVNITFISQTNGQTKTGLILFTDLVHLCCSNNLNWITDLNLVFVFSPLFLLRRGSSFGWSSRTMKFFICSITAAGLMWMLRGSPGSTQVITSVWLSWLADYFHQQVSGLARLQKDKTLKNAFYSSKSGKKWLKKNALHITACGNKKLSTTGSFMALQAF